MKAKQKPTLKVVAHARDHKLIKGYTDALPTTDLEAWLHSPEIDVPKVIPLREAESDQKVMVRLNSLKALFFVKSFEGRKEYKEVKFFDSQPTIEGLWVRVTYYDKESSEGVVRNSLHHVTGAGFFLKPPDPQSNNAFIYVVKSSLIDFRVLGVQRTY